jgi:hypothetical protein
VLPATPQAEGVPRATGQASGGAASGLSADAAGDAIASNKIATGDHKTHEKRRNTRKQNEKLIVFFRVFRVFRGSFLIAGATHIYFSLTS